MLNLVINKWNSSLSMVHNQAFLKQQFRAKALELELPSLNTGLAID